MLRATLKSLLAHKLRLAMTALAIVLGVGFVSGTYILTDTMNRAFDNLFGQIDKGVAVEVSGIQHFKGNGRGGMDAGPAERVSNAVLTQIEQVPGVRIDLLLGLSWGAWNRSPIRSCPQSRFARDGDRSGAGRSAWTPAPHRPTAFGWGTA